MSFPTNWDVSKYKNNFESEEHWELRRKFIDTHKERFPEEKLICLTQVFFNIEFLGCRYPEKTMRLVEELSKGVADEHREKQKGKLKRSFVQASDAAGDKIKRKSQSSSEPPSKIARNDLDSCFVHSKLTVPQTGTEQFPGFILYEHCRPNGVAETCPLNILTQSTQKNQVWKNLTFDFAHNTTPTNEYQVQCDIKINNKLLSSAAGGSNKEAKTNAAIEGLKTLRKSCYTIQAKHAFFSDNPEVSKEGGKQSDLEKPIAQDNIGSRMMQKMGWTGSGLGKQQQGIQAPIQASSQVVQRSGFGRINGKDFENKFKQVFKDFIGSSSDYDLVFTPDFSSDERKILHRSENVADKQNSEEESDDLFSTENVTVESNSEEEECVMCEKLKVISGGECDDDIYDMMWGTNANPTGLLSSCEVEGDVIEITDDETHNMDISAGEEDNLDIFIDYDSDELNSTGKKPVNIFSEKKEKAKRINRLLSRKSDKSMFKYFLPDNSCLHLNMESIKQNYLLYKYTYPYGETQVMRKTVSENDLVNIAGLQDLLFKHAICQRFKPDKTMEKLKTSRFDQYNAARLATNDSNFSLNTENPSTNRGSSFSRATLVDEHLENVEESVNKSLEVFVDSAFSPVIERQPLATDNHALKTKPVKFNDKVKIFFLDGSYKYVSLDAIKDNEELREFTKYSPEKTADEMKCGVTIKDLKKYKSLCEVFADIIAAYRLQFGKTGTQSDTTHYTIQGENNKTYANTTENQKTEYSLLSSKNRTMVSEVDKGKIFLPDGSYKTILVEEIQNNRELIDIFRYYPGKPVSELTIMVTVDEVKNHESLQNLFSEYVIAQKTPIKRTNERDQVPFNLPNESLIHHNFETSPQDKLNHHSSGGNRTFHNLFDMGFPIMYPGGQSNLTPGFRNIASFNPSASFPINNTWVDSSLANNMNQTKTSQISVSTATTIESAYPKNQLSNTPLSTHLDRSFLMSLPGQSGKLFDERSSCSSTAVNLGWSALQGSVDREDTESICSVESRFTKVGMKIQNQSKHSRKHNHGGRPRIKVTFEDESFKRINTKYIEDSKYFIRYKKKMTEIQALGLTMNDVPPADYSDPSDEEDEYNKWAPRFMPSLNEHAKSDAEKHSNEEGKLYLQNAWEKYLIKFASSFKNPVAQKWKEFLEQKSSEVDSIFALRDQWRKFMNLVKEDKLFESSPLKCVQERNTQQNLPKNAQNESLNKSEMLDPSATIQNILPPTFPVTSHMAQLFGIDLHKSPFEELEEPNFNSVPPDLESHLKASTITMVDSMHLDSQFAEPSLVESMGLESHINASTVTIVDSIVPDSQMCTSSSVTETKDSFLVPSQEQCSSKERMPLSGPKKLEDGTVVGYLPDGSKIKFRQLNGMIVTL